MGIFDMGLSSITFRLLLMRLRHHEPQACICLTGVVPENADAGSVAQVADAASIGVTSNGCPELTDAPHHTGLNTSPVCNFG
jgi:hypothetical protein